MWEGPKVKIRKIEPGWDRGVAVGTLKAVMGEIEETLEKLKPPDELDVDQYHQLLILGDGDYKLGDIYLKRTLVPNETQAKRTIKIEVVYT